jgi:hypothetical protein
MNHNESYSCSGVWEHLVIYEMSVESFYYGLQSMCPGKSLLPIQSCTCNVKGILGNILSLKIACFGELLYILLCLGFPGQPT